ncbi:MAG: AsmA-like C-terminal region-containing protein [Bacteroidota bacterium]
MKKALKISGGILLVLLLILILTPFLFQDRIEKEVKTLANRKLKSEINFTKMNLSFFSHFPNLTLTLTDFSLKSCSPFEKDTLIGAHEIAFGVDVNSLFGKTIRITRIYFDKARFNILYNERGAANYNVYQSSDTAVSTAKKDTAKVSGAELNIEHIVFKDCILVYADPTIPIRVVASGLNYAGKSKITSDFFDLTSEVKINALDVVYDRMKVIDSKPVTAKLTTRINNNDLSVNFEKNDLMIKDVPVQFTGKFLFEKEGYQFNMNLLSVLEKEFFTARFKIRQGKTMWISAKVNASMDLGKWSKAMDVKSVAVKGYYDVNFTAEGSYLTGPVRKKGIRNEVDTVILSIPKFDLKTRFTKGSLKYRALPEAISAISFDLNASCPDSNYKNINVHLKSMQLSFLKNLVTGSLDISGLNDMPVVADLHGSCNLSELKQVIPVDSIDFAGILDFNVKVNGNYSPGKKMFPVTTATLDFRDGMVKTKYYPHPIEKIGVHAVVTNHTGTAKDLDISIRPISFLFEGQTFTLNSSMSNPDDLNYDIKANGVIDLGKICKVFAIKGMEVDGYIQASLNLAGRQSDATAGRYDRLHNSGSFSLRNISFSSDMFPKPFIIHTGNFRFDQDKLWFDNFLATYGASDFKLKGALSNILNYALAKGGTLKGDFELNSDKLNVDEFMAYAPSAPSAAKPAESGVVIIPSDLDIKFKAAIKTVSFKGLNIKDLTGETDLEKGILLLRSGGFSLIDCKVKMDATYGSITPQKAFFDFHIKADDFDVKRGYNEIAMIRELASSAGKAEGVVSLDYSLKGRLNADMYPVLPSLEGGGTVSVKKVKFYGLKLFNDISKGTQKEGLNNPDLSKLDVKSTIKNNTITLEQFKFKVKGIRVKIAGTSTFDSKLNMKVRLGMGPFGIIGIPMKITGPMENLKIRYGRGGNETDETKESEYTDELPKEMLDRIKNVKEDTGDDK